MTKYISIIVAAIVLNGCQYPEDGAPGAQGPEGPPGIPGSPGAPGEDGDDGSDASFDPERVYSVAGEWYEVTSDGHWTRLAFCALGDVIITGGCEADVGLGFEDTMVIELVISMPHAGPAENWWQCTWLWPYAVEPAHAFIRGHAVCYAMDP